MPEWDQIRLACFAGLLVLLAVAERAFPRRGEHGPRWRPLHNLLLAAVDVLVVRLLVPAGAVGAALWAQRSGTGLLPALDIGTGPAFVISLLALDCLIYWQHRLFHRVGALWRLHRVHHTDPAFDVTTALRFHPLEIVLSMLIKVAAVVALGCPPLAVVVFEIALNGCAMFNHANLHLPRWAEGPVRAILVTPDMHRIHHSTLRREHDRNYGFNLSIWDRIFGTYLDAPEGGQDGMTVGLADHQDDAPARLGWTLGFPFRKR